MGGSGEEERQLRILVVDDDPSMVRVLKVILKTSDMEVLEATSGIEGYALTRRELPDAVLLDVMMPDMDGFEVCRKLKLDPETEAIPVIFVSAKTAEEHIERGLSLGAQGYVTKPFDPDSLVQKIREVTGGA